MELGEALKYFLSKAEIIINYSDLIRINLLSYFPLLKNGNGKMETIKNIFNLYIKINKLNDDNNRIIVDNLINESFNGIIPTTNYKINSKYCHSIYLYEYIIKNQCFMDSNITILKLDLPDLIDCPEPLKQSYNNLINTINEYDLLESKDFSSVKNIFIKNYKEYHYEINTFDLLTYCSKNFDHKNLKHSDINDIINLNITTIQEINTLHQSRLDCLINEEFKLSEELIKILKEIDKDNVFGAAIIRNNNSYVKIINHNFNDMLSILKIANHNKYNYVMNNIFNTNYLKLLSAVISNNCQKIYEYLYVLNLDPRGFNNHLYNISNNKGIKNMIGDITIKKNILQNKVISIKIEEIIGYSDIPDTISRYINNELL
jgi:hypothetical protein